MRRLCFLLVLIGCVAPFTQKLAQTCAPPAIVANAKSSNFFSPEQETILGELVFQRMTGDIRLVKNDQLAARLDAIGQRLARRLPPTGLKYQFHLIDIPEANAFNIPGGYVFMSRKMVGFANSEDELAGVLAHELGHATVKHGAVDFSDALRRVLNITQVGDRADITAKYNEYLEKWRTKRGGRNAGHESEQQLEADRIGLFAMAAEGYDPNAFTSLFDRLVETKGKTGGWFSDLFGKTKPEEKRLREMVKAAEQLPAQCREKQPAGASQDFIKWQADVVAARDANGAEELPALLWKRELNQKLRGDISHFAFSANGKYLLAQDDFNITVVQREPLQTLFQIPANEALEANFTPDGQFIVFGTENLRYEKWSLAEQKPVAVRELVVRRDCWEHEFSPDGRFLACVDFALNATVIDTNNGKKLWEKPKFYELSVFEYLSWILADRNDDGERNGRLFQIEFSPESKFLTIARSNKFRFVFRINLQTVGNSENTMLSLDLSSLKPVSVSGDLKKITKRPFVFLDDKRILGMGEKVEEGGIFSFPEGKRLAKFAFGAEEIKRAANPNYLIVRPLADGSTGFFDIQRGAVVGALKKRDITIWNNLTLQEARNGQIMLTEVSYDEKEKRFTGKDLGRLDLPVGLIGRMETTQVSENFEWLSFSSRSRGGVWNLATGDRTHHVRGFRGVVLDNSGLALGDFPKLDEVKHSLVLLNSQAKTADAIRVLPERGARQYGRFILLRTSLKENPEKEIAKEDKNKVSQAIFGGETSGPPLSREVRFELIDILQNKTIWSQEFPKQAPRYFFDEFSGRLIFAWDLGSEVGKDKLKTDPQMEARAKAMGNKEDDFLVEVFDAYAGKMVGALLLETGKGSFSISSGFSEGDWLVLNDNDNRVLVYSLKSGEVRHRFFGANAAMNPSYQQIAIENYPGELTVYDLTTGDSQARLSFNGSAVFVRYSVDGKRLFVLSDKQTAYAFDVGKLAALQKATAKN